MLSIVRKYFRSDPSNVLELHPNFNYHIPTLTPYPWL